MVAFAGIVLAGCQTNNAWEAANAACGRINSFDKKWDCMRPGILDGSPLGPRIVSQGDMIASAYRSGALTNAEANIQLQAAKNRIVGNALAGAVASSVAETGAQMEARDAARRAKTFDCTSQAYGTVIRTSCQ